MNTTHSKLRSTAVSFFAILFVATVMFSGPADAESPVVAAQNEVVGEPKVIKTEGEVIKLLWRAKIGGAVAVIPLGSIEHYGIQDYNIDDDSRIRELTITTRSLSMVRIYHIEKKRKYEKGIPPVLRTEDDGLPTKSYPTTTHEKMLEYRVSDVDHIDVLFRSLDRVMEIYLGRQLVPSQRAMIVETVRVGESGGEATDGGE